MNLIKQKDIAIINYGMGNLHSLQNTLNYIKAKNFITSDPEVIRNADSLILPGVGSFGSAMRNINSLGLKEAIYHAVKNRSVPLLGICLGMQLLAYEGEEGDEDRLTKGLELIEGRVTKFNGSKIRLPHIGFNSVDQRSSHSSLFNNINKNSDFYFVHSYHFEYAPPQNVIGVTNYDIEFVSAVQKENIFGVQFHPEKSQSNGLKLLTNFVNA